MYIFDGYNIYHAAKKALEQWANITVMGLCEYIAGDLNYIKQPGKMIYDGVRPRGREDIAQMGSIWIYYSGDYNTDADTLIEELIDHDSAPKRLTIVSSDRRIRSAAKKRKCMSLTSHEYLAEMVRRYSRPAPAAKDAKQKYQGLTPAETKYWMKVFGISDE